jgi:hypothetical protein
MIELRMQLQKRSWCRPDHPSSVTAAVDLVDSPHWNVSTADYRVRGSDYASLSTIGKRGLTRIVLWMRAECPRSSFTGTHSVTPPADRPFRPQTSNLLLAEFAFFPSRRRSSRADPSQSIEGTQFFFLFRYRTTQNHIIPTEHDDEVHLPDSAIPSP